ncbi:MAG TPA: tetratricopeptide repeat protein [Terriglobia bacterium]|nr:tetratricopeptide repeat protein [Terriglobia bacterium]
MLPEGDRLCPRCGQLIPAGHPECPVCTAPQGFLWRLERETLVVISLVLLALFFAITGFVVQRYHATQKALGGHWYQRGEAALNANQPQKAVDAFHTALVYSRDNSAYQMRLAEALIRANRLGEAEVYLRTLWVREPGNGTVNLELGRLGARRGEVSEAIRYYNNAVFGSWDSDPLDHRLETRIELCQFLLSKGERTQAESELIALIALERILPPDAALHAQIGSMFLQVQDYRRALQEFQIALKLKPNTPGAWAGAGEAAYEIGNYTEARRYLEKAVSQNPADLRSAQQLEIGKLILSLDPFARWISQRERIRRTVAAFNQARARVEQCAQSRSVNLQAKPATSPLQNVFAEAKKMRPKATMRSLQRDPDLIPNVMDLVFQMEQQAEQTCGIPPDPDRALLMIARTRGATER